MFALGGTTDMSARSNRLTKTHLRRKDEHPFREPNQQGLRCSRAMDVETAFCHPSTDTKTEIAFNTHYWPMVVAHAPLTLGQEEYILLSLGSLFLLGFRFFGMCQMRRGFERCGVKDGGHDV